METLKIEIIKVKLVEFYTIPVDCKGSNVVVVSRHSCGSYSLSKDRVYLQP